MKINKKGKYFNSVKEVEEFSMEGSDDYSRIMCWVSF